jgi:hypothetical protein
MLSIRYRPLQLAQQQQQLQAASATTLLGLVSSHNAITHTRHQLFLIAGRAATATKLTHQRSQCQ